MSDKEEPESPACEHERVAFDRTRLGRITPSEVRAEFPRFEGTCSCGFRGIAYASYAHYLAGEW